MAMLLSPQQVTSICWDIESGILVVLMRFRCWFCVG
jgi:hypothetical protein